MVGDDEDDNRLAFMPDQATFSLSNSSKPASDSKYDVEPPGREE